MSKLFPIGEVAKLLGISTGALRFYESEGLLVPQKDETTHYRYYSMEDISQLVDILFFRSLGTGIKEIQDVLNARQAPDMRAFFAGKREDVQKNIRQQTILLHKLDAMEEAHQLLSQHLGQFSIRPHPSFYVLDAYGGAYGLPFQQENNDMTALDLYYLSSIGGCLQQGPTGKLEISGHHFQVLRRTAAAHHITNTLPQDALVQSRRSAYTIVALGTPNALAAEALRLLDWMQENGYSQTDTIRFRYLLTSIYRGNAQSYAELWIPIV